MLRHHTRNVTCNQQKNKKMHVILKSNVEEIKNEYNYSDPESKLFEFFCNSIIVSQHYLGRFEPKDVTTEEDDAAIDGFAFIIDGELITTVDDAEQAFKSHKTTLEVLVIVTQIKSGEKFDKKEISNYVLGLKDFFSLKPKMPQGEFNKKSLNIFKVILDNLRKVKNKRPSLISCYATSGVYKAEKEIAASFEILTVELSDTDLFHGIENFAIGRSELLKIHNNISQVNEGKIIVDEFFGMPAMPGIPQSYVAIVKAKEFVTKLLIDSNGNLKNEVFEENIRAYLGNKNPVNEKIKATLKDNEQKLLFSVLNNGITLVTPDLTVTPNSKQFEFVNYQIINGCQTSNTLFENIGDLDDSTKVVIKCIESDDYDKISDIISATNSQSNIDNNAFHSLKTKAKDVQKFFAIQNKSNNANSLVYFERRENEYKHLTYKKSRIFDIKSLSRAYNAMFLEFPFNSARYVSKIFEIQGKNLFKETDNEICYFTSALALYKFNSMVNSKKNDAHTFVKFRWHIIQLFKYVVHSKVELINPGANKVGKYCEKMLKILLDEKKSYEKYFAKCIDIIKELPLPTDDQLKRAKYNAELKQKAIEYLKKGSK
jgi:hypothetical protein